MVSIIMNTVSIMILFLFADKIYPHYYSQKKVRFKYEKFLIIAVASILLAVLHEHEMDIINYVLVVATVNVYNKFFYKTEGYMYILFNVSALLFMLLAEFVSVIMIPLLTHETINEYLEEGNLIISYLINWFVMFAIFEPGYMILKRKNEKLPSITLSEIVAYILLFVFEVIMIGYTTKLASDEKTTTVLILTLCGYTFINLLVAYLIFKTAKNGEIKYENELLQQQSMTQMMLYKDLLEKYDESQRTAHDFKRHLKTLLGLISNEDRARKYLAEFMEETEKMKPQFKSRNAILDVIINHKILQAELKEIEFTVDYSDVDMGFISDMDITIMLANALDNSYEAVEAIEKNRRQVKLIITRMSDFLLINISNSYNNVEQKPDGKFLTTKKNHSGLGLKNVQKAVEKYDGIYKAEVVEDKFKVKITIPIPTSGERSV
ncbi:MAG: GHKL domain-containing protein [Ruminococcus sp.]|nr:GHKL domain-containing protein [Ruminococcus sp.]